MRKQPLILEIKGNSLDDGPGIRSVVFFKGCPLACVWCHNPESKKKDVEISFDSTQCVACHTCIKTCPEKALSINDIFFVDREKCNLCFACVANCPSGALTKVGQTMDIAEIIQEVIKDKPFFDTSKGGVTFSGGEPTLHMTFLAKAAKTLKEKGVHVLLETCGQFHYETFIELVYPYLDMIYYDIKIMDSPTHKKFCGLPNSTILANFKKLYQKYQNGGVNILPRTPLVPYITDTEENLSAIVSFYKEENVRKAQLLPYHPLWQEKNRKIGINASNGEHQLSQWMGNDRINACKKMFTDSGILLA